MAAELQTSTTAIIGTFNKLTVAKDYELRKVIREAGGKYRVVKNKLAAISGTGTQVEAALKGLKGVNSVAFTAGVAEQSNLIIDLGRWVLREACRQQAEWRAAGLPVVPIAVNVSPQQLLSQPLDLLLAPLSEFGITLDEIEIEITESAMMDRLPSATKVIKSLRASGLHISIDDFGTGHSSLGNLRRLPITCSRSTSPSSKTSTGRGKLLTSWQQSSPWRVPCPSTWWPKGSKPRLRRPCCGPTASRSCRAICSTGRCLARPRANSWQTLPKPAPT